MNANTVFFPRTVIALALTLVAAGGHPPAQALDRGMFSGARLSTVSGAEIYQQICQGCHMPDGQGAKGAGLYPALAGDAALASSQYVALTILDGRRNMPAFAAKHSVGIFYAPPTLTDEQVAAVVNFVRTHFGNHYAGSITAAQVEALDHSR